MNDGLTPGIIFGVPLITAFIGYITNWAAVKMIFSPKKFMGIGKIGWQGVIPSRNDKFANDVADTVGTVLSARELIERLDPALIETHIADRLDAELPLVIEEILDVVKSGLWSEMAPPAQEMVVAQVRGEISSVAEQVFIDVKEISDESLDLRALVVDLLSGENADRLGELFQRMGRKELKFIEYYGAIFGLLVGIVQAGLYGVLGQWWVMPLVGVTVGLGTNWLALQMIFRPLEERRYLGFIRYQGMFAKRQPEIAAEYGEVAANEIFTPANLFRVVAQGPSGLKIATVLLRHISTAVDAQRPMVEMLTATQLSDAQIREVQVLLVERLGTRLPELRAEIESVVTERLGIAKLVQERIAALSKPEFERLLRGIFEEDEWILIVIGGVLGGLVGVLQAVLVSG